MPLTASVALATAVMSSSYLSAAPEVSSFFFLPFITLGAVLNPVADCLRFASSLSFAVLSAALVTANLSVVLGTVSAVFFSSLALTVPAAPADLSVPAGLIVALAPPGAPFLSTT